MRVRALRAFPGPDGKQVRAGDVVDVSDTVAAKYVEDGSAEAYKGGERTKEAEKPREYQKDGNPGDPGPTTTADVGAEAAEAAEPKEKPAAKESAAKPHAAKATAKAPAKGKARKGGH